MARERPERPAGCPLFAHSTGQWAKKIDGKTRYFGAWGDLPTALAAYAAYTQRADTSRTTPQVSAGTSAKRRTRPKRPGRDFPLFPHRNGQWCKKIGGQNRYFGPWSNPDAALAAYLREYPAIRQGVEPIRRETATILEVANKFLAAKQSLVGPSGLSQRTVDDYIIAGQILLQVLGGDRLAESIGPADFANLRAAILERYGPTRAGNTIQVIRSIFLYGTDTGLIERAIRYGGQFKKPDAKTMRLQRQSADRWWTAAEIRRLYYAAREPLRTMILLGINCGFGNGDCGSLPVGRIDLENGWHAYHREKTGAPRRMMLWPETIEGLRLAMKRNKIPSLVFSTKPGNPFNASAITHEFAKVQARLSLESSAGFYGLRRTFAQIAGHFGDQIAVNFAMGHASDEKNMPALYRGPALDEKLAAISRAVHAWLFPRPTTDARAINRES